MMVLVIRGIVLFAIVTLIHPTAMKSIDIAIQDIEGGAKRIFGERPANPLTDRKTESNEQRPEQRGNKTVANNAVEDALALGNSARDANPPRYADAERAYRLAARLNSEDARSYIGLANVMYDQHRYVEAAKMYRHALTLLSASVQGNGGRTGERAIKIGPDELARTQATYHAHLGSCLLFENQLSAAEKEFLLAVSYSSKDARWYALLGYTYSLQNRLDEASSKFKTAIRLDPNTSVYRDMLKSVSR